MAKFDDTMMRAFEKYLELQKSGEINMVSSRVRDILGISKEEHAFIMSNYKELLDEYTALKVVDEVIADAKDRVSDTHGKGKSKSRGKKVTSKEVDEEVAEDLYGQELD